MGNLYLQYKEGFPNNLNDVFIETETKNQITYSDLEKHSAAYSVGFKKLGLNRGDRVTLQVDKSVEVFFIYLACLRSGLIFHPLNTAYKDSELRFFLNDAEPTVFICESTIFNKIAELNLKRKPANIFTLDSIHKIKIYEDHEILDCPDDEVAALLYSSGTTGNPKGIMLTHKNIGSNSETLADCWDFQKDDCLLHALPIYHVHGLFVALGCSLLSGSKVQWMDSFDSEKVIQALSKCTVMMGVPTYYSRLLSSQNLNKSNTSNVRLFISGSAPLLEDTFQEFKSRTGKEILERYGMTETNIISSNPIEGKRKPSSVGLCLQGQKLRIVDDANKPLNVEEIGDIQVSGPNVFKGYWNLPDKTAEEFTSDNYFKTGDKGYLDKDGYLFIVGRNKDMIISGGLNVYPKEVETFIDEIDGVNESAVIGLKDDDFGEKVVAIIVLDEKSDLKEAEIINLAKESIAGFKAPKEVIFINELPRNAMGKVQKNILRDLYKS